MKNNLKNLTITAMLFALGMVLSFFTGQIPQIGGMLLPMHLPVFLCSINLRLAVWPSYGFSITTAAFNAFWDAANLSNSACNGF